MNPLYMIYDVKSSIETVVNGLTTKGYFLTCFIKGITENFLRLNFQDKNKKIKAINC